VTPWALHCIACCGEHLAWCSSMRGPVCALIALSQYYLDTQVLPTLMREHKLHAAWAAAGQRYYDAIWKFNYAYDRDLRYRCRRFSSRWLKAWGESWMLCLTTVLIGQGMRHAQLDWTLRVVPWRPILSRLSLMMMQNKAAGQDRTASFLSTRARLLLG
jgi:hypothetical protein